ncbi:MAG: sodium:proton antiporter [Nitrososphaerota archaeon]|nr:sodium:proton antiporter [Nitrososphaerota archaeon]
MVSIELLITGFLAILLVASLISIKSKLPYTIVLVFIGIGLVFLLSNSFLLSSSLIGTALSQIKDYTLTIGSSQGGQLFIGLIVPPLIFQAMIHIKSSDLRLILQPAFVLATIGVAIATLVVGVIIWLVTPLGLFVSFLFAAIVSPTDTATVLEIFRRIKVPSKLATLLETEAAFNDATGIIIFTIIVTSITASRLPLFTAALTFLLLFGGGVAVGFGIGFVAELIVSVVTDRLTEIILTIVVVYGSYVTATALGFSGLIAVSVAGLYFGNYTIKTAITPSNREAVRIFWEIAAFIGNSVAFLFIGLRTDLLKISQSLELIVIAYLVVIAARAATVYPILTIFDKIGKRVESSFPMKWRNVAMIGGMRGALSIALSAAVFSYPVISETNSDTISTLVLGVAFTSIIAQGAFLSSYTKRTFPEEEKKQEEEFTARLAKAASAIDSLQKMRREGNVTNEEYQLQLETNRDSLAEMLAQLETTIGPTDILKTRASRLYDSLSFSNKGSRKKNGRREKDKQKIMTDYVDKKDKKTDE